MSGMYDSARDAFLAGTLTWNNAGGTLRGYLVKPAYVFAATHSTLADVTAANVVGGQFTEGAGKGVKAMSAPTHADGVADGEDLVFAAVTAGDTFTQVVLAKCGGLGAGADPLIGCWDVATTVTDGSDIVVQWAMSTPLMFQL